jgi:hypothetical protein
MKIGNNSMTKVEIAIRKDSGSYSAKYEGTKTNHAEEVLFNDTKHESKNPLNLEMNAWPCTGERHHNCHELLKKQSGQRVIILKITGDQGGYAQNHLPMSQHNNTIVYTNGNVRYDYQ